MLRGTTAFLRDLPHDDCLEVVFVRSTEAHARILGIDTAEAIASPGVRAVLTAADLDLPAFRYYEPIPEAFARPLVATDRVRTVGEIVALVVADSSALATDASELVAVEYEPLPVVMTPADALAPGAPLLFEAAGSNVVLQYDRGRDEDLFDGAARRRAAPLPQPPPRFRPARTERGDRPTDGRRPRRLGDVTGRARRSGRARRALGLDEAHIRVRAAAVGGGFGGRHSRRGRARGRGRGSTLPPAPPPLGRDPHREPARMVHGRAQCHEVAVGFDDDGRIVGPAGPEPRRLRRLPPLRPADAVHQPQAGVRPVPRAAASTTRGRASSPTRHPIGPYRGAGQPEVTNGLERIMDGRRPFPRPRPRRAAAPQPAPPRRPAPHDPDRADLRQRRLSRRPRPGLRAGRLRRGAGRAGGSPRPGDPPQLGVGVACYVSLHRRPHGVRVRRRRRLRRTAQVTVAAARSATARAMPRRSRTVVADRARRRPARGPLPRRRHRRVPRGQGTGGSRSAQMAGSAAHAAAGEVLERAGACAAARSRPTPPTSWSWRRTATGPAGLGVVGVPASVMAWARPRPRKPARRVSAPRSTCASTAPPSPPAPTPRWSRSTPRPATCAVRHVAVDDCGTVLNRMVVAGQQHGGGAAGIGQALFESVELRRRRHAADHQLRGLPRRRPPPSCRSSATETLDIPTPVAPNGAKGIGENGAIVAPVSVQNAVIDALAHLGVRHIDLPVTPERVWRAVRDAAGDGDRRANRSG